MRFIKNTQTKTVRASGAISRLLPWNVSLTELSTISTTISIAAWNFVGFSVDDFRATRQKRNVKVTPRNSDQNIESTLIAHMLPAHSFQTQSPASFLQTWRFCRW